MLEEQSKTSFLEWLHTKLGLYLAGIVTLLALGIGAWVPEIITVGVALPLLGLLLLCIPILLVNGARVANHQRAKISSLEARILGLESEKSSLLNPPLPELDQRDDTEEKILAFLTPPKGRTLEQVAAHIGTSTTKAEVVLGGLAVSLLVYRQDYTEGPSRWCLGTAGKTYLVDHGKE